MKLAESRLPAEVVQNGIEVEKQAASQLMTLTLMSDDPKFDEIYLSNFATLYVLDLLRRIPGVGRVSNIGSRYYAMQIWVDPAKLANYGLTVQDLQNALKDQNRESAAGVLGQQPMSNGIDITIPITAQGRLSSASQFEEIVLRANPDGSLIRMKDVARVSLEASSYSTESGINGGNAAVLGIYMLPGANAMEVAQRVKDTMEEISQTFPEGLEYNFPFDMTNYISQSIHEVYKTLFEALFLVIVVVFLSLQSWRATLIPVVAVPISLIGTFGFMLIFGFSLNMLTLLGLVLAIGIVGRCHRGGGKCGTNNGGGKTQSLRGHKESYGRSCRSRNRNITGAGCGVRTRKFPLRYHRSVVPPIYCNNSSVGTSFYSCGIDIKSGDVFSDIETY